MPQQVEQCEKVGYTDDYKFLTTNPADRPSDIYKIEKMVQRDQDRIKRN